MRPFVFALRHWIEKHSNKLSIKTCLFYFTDDVQISSEQANSFTRTKTLSLGKRDIYEECYSENCDFEEVQETYGVTRKGVCLIRDIKHDVKPNGKRQK